MTYRLGIIGAGGIGTIHTEISTRAGTRPTAICDPDAAKAQALAAAHDVEHTFTDADAMFEADAVDAVVIAVPNHLHVPLAVRALATGHDVLLEKPMSSTLEGCAPLIEAAASTDRLVQMNFVTRHAAAVRAVMPIIEDGTLGNIYHVSACMVRQRGVPGLGRWFTTADQSGGGVLIDLGVHLIDLVLHLTGRPEPTEVHATLRCVFAKDIASYAFDDMWAGPPDVGGVCDVEDTAFGMMRFENGMTSDLHVAWASNVAPGVLPEGVVLFGDRASCHVDPWNGVARVMEGQGGHVHEHRLTIDVENAWDDAWIRQHEVFADIVTNRTAPSAPVAHGVEAQRILDGMYGGA